MNHPGRLILISLAITVYISLMGMSPCCGQQPKGESLLQKGDSIEVYVDIEDFETLKTKSAGSKVTIKVLDHVDRFGKNLIAKYAPVHCTVFKRKRPGSFGRAGELVLQIDSTHSTAGTKVPLKGEIKLKGNKKTIAVILFFVGWAMRGGDVEFPEGENTFKPVVAERTPLEYLK